ncbi:kynureninase [Flocculibacter collagenilyticus]|uniref:kynureninase n=1 Tax=Flocculibacter collagenilyticus TaxID=2744479 RepID=UPI0018F32990|nr:kynureninase [Flocculibacter collagenilyticus]
MTEQVQNNQFQPNLAFAQTLDQQDPLASFKDAFHIPKQANGENELYFVGNSLGLQPTLTAEYVNEELKKWQTLGVKGHFDCEFPWMPYHEFLTEQSADLVGAKPNEVVCMNSLTANLHFMMVSFYQPTKTRYKILIEDHAFPSDHYAVTSQIKHHGFDPNEALLLIAPRDGEELINHDDIKELIEREGDSIALILLPGVQYYTGQVLDMQRITQWGHAKGIKVGFDLAHAAGNITMQLHDWQVDFACWCSYKYMNSGPGSVAGCFVHERHSSNTNLNRFAGWWGHDKQTRFKMENTFNPIPTAEGWQLSNPPILSLAAIRASLAVFKNAGGMSVLCEKSTRLTNYFEYLLQHELGDLVRIITPSDPAQRGCQLSLTVNIAGKQGKEVFKSLEEAGVTTDWREPNVIRAAPVPLYNSFTDVYHFVRVLKSCLI